MTRLPEASDIALRLTHLAGTLFTSTLVASVLLGVACGAVPGSRVRRERVLLAASALALAWFVTPVVAVLMVAGVVALFAVVEGAVSPLMRRVGVATWVLIVIVAPVVGIGWLSAIAGSTKEVVAFATNMGLLRGIAYARSRSSGQLERPTFERYLLYSLFFPTLVNGPIESPGTFLDGPWSAPTTRQWQMGTRRIAQGVAKMVLVAVVGSPEWTAQLRHHLDASALWLWGWSVLLYAWFYLCFSAWSDVAVGVSALCGRTAPENFAAPWWAANPADFWRRWHVSFGKWLVDHVYVPLGGNRRYRARNVAAVFAVSAAWHVWGSLKLFGLGYYPVAAWWGFGVWGGLHALAVATVPSAPRRGFGRGLATIATFAFAAWAWLPFFTPAPIDLWTGCRLMARMLGLPV